MLSDSLDKIGFYPNTYAVVGILSDKDAVQILKKTIDKIDLWFFTSLNKDLAANRTRSAKSLLNALHTLNPKAKAKCFKNPSEAFNSASQLALSNDRIVVFGSFITVSSIWVQAHDLGKP